MSVTHAIPHTRLFLNACYYALSNNDAVIYITPDVRYELQFWHGIREYSGSKQWWPEHHILFQQQLYTDASNHRWGAIIQHNGHDLQFSGIWPDYIRFAEPPPHINTLELYAIEFFLRAAINHWPDLFSNVRLDICVDNTSAIQAILTEGTRSPEMLIPLRNIFELLTFNNILLRPYYVNTHHNLADAPSRIRDRYEFKLTANTFNYIEMTSGPHTIDAFASDATAQLPRFYSRYIEPNSSGINAFTQNYAAEHVYAFPPTALAPYFVRLLQQQHARGTVVIEQLEPLPSYWPILITLCNITVTLWCESAQVIIDLEC
jgi:hypothetical protein